ncbi:MMPL family protein [Rubripirellula lacrimiformis]|uniref:MMPL family protein n=1 Tax=Rubripirellula lacrimiformis TaxID=1930273 RepID=A0A517NL76_9BACT|nr:MMPL family transporter [Rubripirellula lacrimiformis]QDT07829.1 MMPL family protein [Rubripirellula lacrimiformis]
MKQTSLLERRGPLGIPYALLILLAFFFCLPAAFRAARMSLGEKENDVKDWLPSNFAETAELEWFADHFAGESFVLATWEGCNVEDQRLTLLASKLTHESDTYDPSADFPPELAATYRRAKDVGNELGLLQGGTDHLNWGGKNEKWLSTPSGQWYYVTPDGKLYRWEESMTGPAALIRSVKKARGVYELGGTLVTAFGEAPSDAPGSRLANPFYNDLSLLTASLFHSVQTGETIVQQLAQEGGPLWPVDLTDQSQRAKVARRLAMERLTGTLFAPAVPQGFTWTPEAFREALPEKRQSEVTPDFDVIAANSLTKYLDDHFGGSLEQLQQAPLHEQAEAWYAVWDAAGIESPHRLTCVLVTLTDLAKDNLVYAIGRGVLGQPRGRLLQLAADSGLRPAGPPSMAPPPFNRQAAEPADGLAAFRMGGPPVDNMAIDEEGTVTLVRLVGYSVLIGILLSYVCFRSVKITIMIFVVGGSSAMLSMAMVWWTGGKVDAILMSMPSLVYVLGLSGAIHVVNYYRDEVRARGTTGAAGRALRHAIVPCTLASLTTAIGLVSLVTSNLAPISNFGLYAGIGVMSTLGILFSYLPAALQTFTPSVTDSPAASEASDNPDELNTESGLSDWWAGFGRWVTGHHRMVTVGCLLVLFACAIGMRHIKTSVQLLKLFDPDARIIHDYAWLEDHFGKLVPMELIVRMPPQMQAESDAAGIAAADGEGAAEPLDILERVEAVSRIRRVVHRTLGEPGLGIVGQSTSSDTFLPELPGPSNGYNAVRAKFNRELLAAGDTLRDNDYLKLEKEGDYSGSELWRISLRVAALSDVDYGEFISTLRTAVEPVLRAYETRDELMKQIAADPVDQKFVLVVGAKRPASLDAIDLVSEDRTEILTNNTFVATLGELLAGEQIEKPMWIDPTTEQAADMKSSGRWEKILAKYKTVVWLGGESFAQADFAAAKHFVDANAIEHKIVSPSLLPGQIPDVDGAGPMQVIYTGVIPVVYKAQRTLLVSLADSIALAFVLIWIVMVLLLNPGRVPYGWFTMGNMGNGFAAGAVAMIPNVFPVLTIFGLMCHMGIEIDIGTMMTASVAMGVAVDDTIHFLSWFRDNLDRGLTRVEALIETYRRVGPAMTQTTIVGGLGLFVFALSTFTPTQRFGTLMLVMLAAALIGDLVMLPALLAGPLGRFFKPRLDADGRPVKSASLSNQDDDTDQSSSDRPTTFSDNGVNGPSRLDRPDLVDGTPRLKVHLPPNQGSPHHQD